MLTYQQFLKSLITFWENQGCIIHQGYDLEMGAGTFNPATFLRSLGPEPYRAAYIESCRRPSDGRYGENPNRLQHYFQFQVMLKPSPLDIQEIYLKSLESLGFDLTSHDIRFVHDDWESPTLGAWGLGWEVWLDGMEVSQFTYFQAVGGVDLNPITGEITYGTERLAMYLQKVDSVYDLKWNDTLTYGDIYKQNEKEWSHYNFEQATTDLWFRHFEDYEKEAKKILQAALPLVAYDFVMKASHAFNILDARGAISVTERTGYIGRIRDLSKQVAETYLHSRQIQSFPLLRSESSSKNTSCLFPPSLSEKLLKSCPNETDNYLLEIGSEELPATFVTIGMQNLERQMRLLLEKEKLSFEKLSVYGTPRRLAIFVHQLVKATAVQLIEKKGPSLEQAYFSSGEVKPAGEGFFRSLNQPVPSLEALHQGLVPHLEIRLIKEVPYLFGTFQQEAKSTAKILQEQLPYLILNLDFPKKMRWSDLTISYPRPLKWIVSLFGSEVLPFKLGPIEAGRLTKGHHQLFPKSFKIETATDYLTTLRQLFVLADPQEREESIKNQLDLLMKEHHLKIIEKEKVIPQVLNLVECPYLTFASFSPDFLKAPKEVLISEMVEHQKFFPVVQEDESLINFFIITANVPPTKQICEGNQKVLSARLSDGVFLYNEDLKIPLEELNEKLKKVTFQKELGTVYEKVERLVAHTHFIQKALLISSLEKASRAALLCKADLASHMVYEFPELQGTIGKYYALAQKEEAEVAQAIEEHWMPQGEKACLPETETGIVISLADKIDNLIGCFSIGLKPSSSSDPYALRRQVLGLIKILIKKNYCFSLKKCLKKCLSHFPSSLIKNPSEVIQEILTFITNRVKTVFQEDGFRKDEIEASLSLGCDDIYDIFCRIRALHHFRLRSTDQFNLLYEVYKRAKGQIDTKALCQIDENLLLEPSEKKLYEFLNEQQVTFNQFLVQRKYDQAYELLSFFQPVLAHLFENVKILAEDLKIRTNRLALLKQVFNLFDQLIDFSKIQI